MINFKKYHFAFIASFLLITLSLSAAFASAEKSLIAEAIPLIADNYIDQPEMSFLAAQALEGARLKLSASQKNIKEDDFPAYRGNDKNEVIAFIRQRLSLISERSGVSYQDLEYSALKNMVSSLDPNSYFLTPAEMKDLNVSVKGVFAGVGMEIGIKDDILTVVSPLDDSPALAAGISAGDQILQINDQPTKNMTIVEAVNLIRGEAGTVVRILVKRKGFDRPKEFRIRRALINIKIVKYRQLEEGIGYLRITSFQTNTSEKVEEALAALGSRQQKLKGLVLDLRNDPGGLLDQSVKVADKFIDNELILTIKGRTADSEIKFTGKTIGTHPAYPIIILINNGSASASEILAGSLHFYGKAVLLGEKTFGKGSIQTIYDLSDGSGLRLTTSRYYLPSGKSIGQGILPDVAVAEKEDKDYPLAIAQETLQKSMGKGHVNFDKLVNLARQTAGSTMRPGEQPVAAIDKVSGRPATPAAGGIDKPHFGSAEKIWTENDLAVIIGIEKYQDLPFAEYSAGDARLVKDYLISLGLKERNVELLLNERATLSSIKKTLETWLPNRARKNSRLLIYYSGHGAPEAASGEAYLVPYDGDPNYLSDTGYPLKRMYERLGRLPVKEVIVVLDSCFSGAGGRSVLAKGARPLVMTASLPVISSNMVVLSAAEGNQISTSSPDKGHGLFTYYFLKALNDGRKNIADIYEYLRPQVEDDAKALNVRQTPQLSTAPEKINKKFYLRN